MVLHVAEEVERWEVVSGCAITGMHREKGTVALEGEQECCTRSFGC